MAQVPIAGLRSHAQQVCSLYKRAARNLDSWVDSRSNFRLEVTMLRARFDEKKNITDMILARKLLKDGEAELFKCLHFQPKKFPSSPGGAAYGRVVTAPDWVLDYWHPLEKARYPKYFATREARKKEYIAWWEKQYGKPKPEDLQH